MVNLEAEGVKRRIFLASRSVLGFWRRFRRNKAGVAGVIVFSTISFIAISAPVLSPYDPFKMVLEPENLLRPPTFDHLMGTDHLGRDMLSRIIWGARISLYVGFVAAGVATLVGSVLGAVSGYYGGWVDDLIMRFVEMFLVVPTFFLIIVVTVLFGSNLFNIMLLIGLTAWPSTARLIRAQFLSLKQTDFVEAERSLGARDRRLIFKIILPNGFHPAIVNASLLIAEAILIEAALSFLGVGDPTQVSWGLMLRDAQRFLEDVWWMALFPGIMISIAVLAFNLMGDGLNDALNPRLRER